MNEIDFRVDYGRSRNLLALNTQKLLKTVNLNNREYLTFIKVINDEEIFEKILRNACKSHQNRNFSL